MTSEFKVAVFNGDGIGPEIMAVTLQILKKLIGHTNHYHLTFNEVDAGAAHYAATGDALPQSSLATAKHADAILLSAMGLPDVRYSDGTEISPQIELRKVLKLFAGVRPVRITAGQKTPLALPNNTSVDFVLIRESTEGLFYSQGKGKVNADEATETLKITKDTSRKLFQFAFALARQRSTKRTQAPQVTCIDKANVFRAFAFFRELFQQEALCHQDISSNSIYVDAAALWMVQKPWIFDVLVTENMFGDILSDLGAGIMGGLGLAPSADIGENHAVFQPCHGSAPDIAGKSIANPFAMILSAAMMLDWLGIKHANQALIRDAKKLTDAVYTVVQDGKNVTCDLGGASSTTEAACAVIKALEAV